MRASTSALLVSQPTRRPAILTRCTLDSNGAKFDGIGNRFNWWTKEDYKKSEAKAKAVVDQYSKLEYLGQKINGQRTLPENNVDIAGLQVALLREFSLIE
ncbi:M13-type metalloendopeptidase [Paenibacillus sp. 1_12]|uniref:M13-type metalloendopeptidase n=1 Tax=Paenibacillus sp. 1_12 TaxID=1566278 RepID=UPI000B80ADB0